MIHEHQRNPYNSGDRAADHDDPRRAVDQRDLEPRAADPRSGDPRRAQQIHSSQPQDVRRQQPGYARQDEPRFGEVRARDRDEVRSDAGDERYSRYDEGGYVREERHDREVERYRELNREDREHAEERRRERRERDRDRDCSPAEIQAEIAETRADISETIDALQAKLSPGAMLHSVVDRVTQDTGRSAREVVCALGRNPVPAVLVGAGLLWLVLEDRTSIGQKRSRSAGRDEMWVQGDGFDAAGRYGADSHRKHKGGGGLHIGERLQSAGGAISDALHSARRAISGAGGRASDMADDVRHRARAMSHNVRDRLDDVSHSARESARDAGGRVQHIAEATRDRAEDAYEHNPLAIGAAAIAAGMLAGLLIPSTRREDELMGEARDDLLDSAKHMTRGTLRAGMRVVKESAEAIEDEAHRQNLDPEHLVEGVRKVAGAAVETARDKVEEESDRMSSSSSKSGGQGSQQQQQKGRSGSQGSSGSAVNRPGQQRGGAGGTT